MDVTFTIPELDERDIGGISYEAILPAVNSALRDYTIDRFFVGLKIPPSKIEPKLKTLARGGKVSRSDNLLWRAVDRELARARSQLQTHNERAVAAQAAANTRARIEFNKKHHGKGTNRGNLDFIHLVEFLGSAWAGHTDKWPVVSSNAASKTSEFIEFVQTALLRFCEKIPPELEAAMPTFKSELSRRASSFDAIHATTRKSLIYRFSQVTKN